MSMDVFSPVTPQPVRWEREGPRRVERLRRRDHAPPGAEPDRPRRWPSEDDREDGGEPPRKGRFLALDA